MGEILLSRASSIVMRLIKNSDLQRRPGRPGCDRSPRIGSPSGLRQQDTHDSELVSSYVAEIMYNLIPSKSSNPLVQEIREELDSEFQARLSFRYRPEYGTLDVATRGRALNEKQKNHVIKRLWQLTWNRINVILTHEECCFQD